jgi:hypothetical protein
LASSISEPSIITLVKPERIVWNLLQVVDVEGRHAVAVLGGMV